MNKREALNYRDAGNNPGCAECEHCEKLECPVIEGRVHYDMRCDAWNDKTMENTWYFFLHVFKNTVCVLVKEDKTTISRMEFPLADDIEKKVIDILGQHTKALGCPDIVCNISPRKFKPVTFKSWLDFRGIQYRELDAEIDKMGFKVDGDMTVLDVLSMMIDVAVVHPKEEENHETHGN